METLEIDQRGGRICLCVKPRDLLYLREFWKGKKNTDQKEFPHALFIRPYRPLPVSLLLLFRIRSVIEQQRKGRNREEAGGGARGRRVPFHVEHNRGKRRHRGEREDGLAERGSRRG